MLMLFLIKLCFCSRGQLLYNSCYSTSIVKIYFVFGFCRKSFFRLTPGLINTLASGFPSEKPASIAQPHLRSILGNLHVFFPALTGALDPSRPLVRDCLLGVFFSSASSRELVKLSSHGCTEMVQISAWHQPWSLMREIDGELWASKDWSLNLWTQ